MDRLEKLGCLAMFFILAAFCVVLMVQAFQAGMPLTFALLPIAILAILVGPIVSILRLPR